MKATEVIEAQGFVLKDAEGRTKAELVLNEKGLPMLRLYGKLADEAKPLVEIQVIEGDFEEGLLALHDEDGDLRLWLSQSCLMMLGAGGFELDGKVPQVMLEGPREGGNAGLSIMDGPGLETLRAAWPQPAPYERIVKVLRRMRDPQAQAHVAALVEMMADTNVGQHKTERAEAAVVGSQPEAEGADEGKASESDTPIETASAVSEPWTPSKPPQAYPKVSSQNGIAVSATEPRR